MSHPPPDHTRLYDGPWWPQTAEQQAAERAYRDAFLAAARQAAGWNEIDEDAIQMLVEKADTRLVVIDPVPGYLGNIDSHRNSEVRGLLAPLAELAGRYRVAILTVTHMSKSGGPKAIYRAMGSLAFAAAARAVWAITKDPDDPQRRLFLPAKLNLARDPDGLAYRIEYTRVCWEFQPVRMHADDAFAAEAVAANRPPKVTR